MPRFVATWDVAFGWLQAQASFLKSKASSAGCMAHPLGSCIAEKLHVRLAKKTSRRRSTTHSQRRCSRTDIKWAHVWSCRYK